MNLRTPSDWGSFHIPYLVKLLIKVSKITKYEKFKKSSNSNTSSPFQKLIASHSLYYVFDFRILIVVL